MRSGTTLYWIPAFSVPAKVLFQNGNIYTARHLFFMESSNSYHEVDKNQWCCAGMLLGLVVATKWYCPQHIVASTLLKPRFWGTIFQIPPTVCTNRISTLPKVEFWTTRVQDLQNILTNHICESIVSLLRCRFVTTVSQILTFCLVSSSSWWCLVILWVLIRAHSCTDSDIRRCELLV